MKKTTKMIAGKKVGILGGGQLARMMALDALACGFEVHILSEKDSDPAAQVTRHWHKGSPHQVADLKKFFAKVPTITFESEFYDAKLLQKMVSRKVEIHPSPKIMASIQDRLFQKQLLEKHKVPTSPFLQVDRKEDISSAFDELGPCVLKTRKNGYDGYGTTVLKTKPSLKRQIESLKTCPDGWIAEKFVPFDREIAVVVARDVFGKVFFYPFVETYQHDSRCLWVKGPLKIDPKPLKKKIKNLLDRSEYVGVLAFELFQRGSELIVNELAPRVHNSGHYTQDAYSKSQFLMHIECISGLPLSRPAPLAGGFAMYNLLGQGTRSPNWKQPVGDGMNVHWYGKHQSRKGRKMGHINCVSPSGEIALKRLKSIRGTFKV